MKFRLPILILFFLVFCSKNYGQFQFSGEVNSDYIYSKVYLNVIDNYKHNELFLTEKIIQETTVDSLGYFIFEGDFLSEKNKYYKIYIDKCNDNVMDYNHLLNHCDESSYTVFIANNQDEIHFPLNDLEQMFCDFKYTSRQNIAIHRIDSIQEVLLNDLQDSKNDKQRKIIYNNYTKKLQRFSKSLNEPLAELYSFNLYTSEQSFSRPFYLDDLQQSNYYDDLSKRLQIQYPNSNYTAQFSTDIKRDRLLFEKETLNPIVLILGGILLVSLSFNFIFIRRNRKKKSKIDYKIVLSPQEQNVFELMKQNHSNKEIADVLFISVSTVKTHINNIYSKLSISSRKEIDHFF